VELACGGLPDFTTCHFSPAIPVLDGAATTPVTLTVSYSPPAAAMLLPSRRNTPWGLILAGLAGLVLVVLMPVARPVRPLVWLGCLLTLAACGGGGGGSLPASGGAISPPPTPSQAAVQLIPSHMDFGAVQVGESSATQTFAITNPGTAPLRLNSLGVVGVGGNGTDFRQTNTCAVTLNPGGQCSVGVQFVPSAVGARSGTFEVNLAGSSSPQTAMVTGTGVHTELVPATYWFTVTAQAGGQSQPLQLALIVH
jgi:hypothetical protein